MTKLPPMPNGQDCNAGKVTAPDGPSSHGPAGIAALRSNPAAPHSRTCAPPPPDPRIVLVLQGGGALGSYQAGVFEALAEASTIPSWVAGVSIGAINAALIAGNPPARRVERLAAFWQRVTAHTQFFPTMALPGWRTMEQTIGAAGAMFLGQPGFFRPRGIFEWMPAEWLTGTGPDSFYDAAGLRSSLEELVDFDRINEGPMRLSVGAVNVETGNLAYFDSARMRVGPEHVMASGALPPGLPSVDIDGQSYWDGGLVSNTPLQYVLAERPHQHSLVFQVDLFPARGKKPTNLDEVGEREKDIRFSSRTRTGTNDAGEAQNRRRQLNAFLDRLPDHLADDPVAQQLRAYASSALIDVVQMIYRPRQPQGAMKDFQFDRGTMERRWARGLSDARVSLEAKPWTAPVEEHVGFRTFDLFAPK